MADVGDVDPHLEIAAGELLDVNGVVEVLCVDRVDGKRRLVAEVQSAVDFRLRNLDGDVVGLRFDLRREVGLHVHAHRQGQDPHVGIVGGADHSQDFAFRGGLPAVESVNRDDHLLPVLCPAEVVGRDVDLLENPAVVGFDEGEVAAMVECAHDFRPATFDDFENFALGLFALLGPGDDGHAHDVPVQGLAHVGFANEELLLAVDGLNEPESLLLAPKDTGAMGFLGVLLVLVLPALPLYEASGAHLGQDVAELKVQIVVLDAEALGDLPRAVSAVGVVSEKLENLRSERIGARGGLGVGLSHVR